MIRELVRVCAVNGETASIEPQHRENCRQCASGRGCGLQGIFKMFGNRVRRFEARIATTVKPGDYAYVEIGERAFLLVVLVAYLVPIMFLIATAIGFQTLIPAIPERSLAVYSIGGFFLGILMSRNAVKWIAELKRFQPVLTSRVVPGVETRTASHKSDE